MRELYLMRHGETTWSREGKHTGHTDIPLTELGEKQAAQLGRRIEKIKFSHVFSSPLKRAKDTCTICGLNPKTDPALLEWDYGAYEGMTTEEIHKTNPDWNVFVHGAPNGESVDTIMKRADRFLKKMEGLEGKIAIFTSAHFARAFLARWLTLPLEMGKRFMLSTTSLSILSYEHDNRALKVWNDASHCE